jgi:hydrogenase maturation factor
LNWSVLEPLLDRTWDGHPEVLVGPQLGEDAAVIDVGPTCLVAATDPVTFATDAIGYYAVQVNANDVATMGAVPQWFLATLLLPERGTTEELVIELFNQLRSACRGIGVALVGGHTEVTAGLERPIIVGTMLGVVDKDRLVTSSGMHPGDLVVCTKGVAVEGTALIAREKAESLNTKYNSEFIKRAKNMLYNPGIGVVRDAKVAGGSAKVHAMHDPTEGGLATGLWELAEASQVGLVADRQRVPGL